MKDKFDIAVIGLGVMGANMTLNLAERGFSVVAFDINIERCDDLVNRHKSLTGKEIVTVTDLSELLLQLDSPRRIILSVPAGVIVDSICQDLLSAGLLEDDIVVDTGNSQWRDSIKRGEQYTGKFNFFTCAISGGEVGARFGPSLMASGDKIAWDILKPMWQAISAKIDPVTGVEIARTQVNQPLPEGEPCADYIGPLGAGHFVKMVHNGIEYADMQMIAETVHFMRKILNMSVAEVGAVFDQWNKGKLQSYLIEITGNILKVVDPRTKQPLLDLIMDQASQKGTGNWTAREALELGVPANAIAESVFARCLSTQKAVRLVGAELLSGPKLNKEDKKYWIDKLEDALYCSKICSYAQGFELFSAAEKEHNWTLDYVAIANIWRGGCVIRAYFLDDIAKAYQAEPQLANLMFAQRFNQTLASNQLAWREVLAKAIMQGIPMPASSAAMSYYDSYREADSSANLIQAMRDYFGGHTYRRKDCDANQSFHYDWHFGGGEQAVKH
ncbi:NADP-dependent phosphogluconate dehydrogenase [Psychromonas hadalis]|uniref:NADP-dependent phosphogluconate dehydrogenase n=1 Tax=Psychromonas hadalis TaxID=211669 RepID=UPI0003B4B1FD|nr:NADP-dependent phosphogluconate dehydrogenase [Psychromonas hadalis]